MNHQRTHPCFAPLRLALPLLAATLLPAAVALAAPTEPDPATRRAIVEKVASIVAANYLDAERALAVERALRANGDDGKYATPDSPEAFLESLNRDLQALAQDRHLRVGYNPRIVAQLRQESPGGKHFAPEYLRMVKLENYRLRRVESLDGNVGYVKLDNFVELEIVERALVGAMEFLNSSSALVLDFRENGGGASDSADFLLSYFLPEGYEVGESWNRATDETTLSIVRRAPIVRPLLDVPIAVLVSDRTASAAEAVAYALQQAKRAIVVGGRTKGLANAGVRFVVDDGLFVMVPTIRHRSAVSGTNWEGTGVTPDVEAAPEVALDAALGALLRTLGERESDEARRRELLFRAQAYRATVSPLEPPAPLVAAAVGEFEGGRRITAECGELAFVQGETKRRLRYLGDDTFAVDGRSDYRIRLRPESDGASRLEVLWYDETADAFARVAPTRAAEARPGRR